MNSTMLRPEGASLRAHYVLAFDTSNEVIAIGLGLLQPASCGVELVASIEVAAHRASNTQLLPRIDALLSAEGVQQEQLACVVVGCGPGSFTGVRIAMATAKGIASALEAPLIGVSSLDVVAWNAWREGERGLLAVVADAMRKEVYPVRYRLQDAGIERLDADRVVKAEMAVEELMADDTWAQACVAKQCFISGDGLTKYEDLFTPCGTLLNQAVWAPSGRGLLLALQDAWRANEVDPLDAQRHNPAFALPVYTRLSDAEENERIRLAKNDPKNLTAGVQDTASRRDQRASMNDTAILNALPNEQGIVYKPLDAAHVAAVACLDACVLPEDAWSAQSFADELPRADRTWWAAYAPAPDEQQAPGTQQPCGAQQVFDACQASGAQHVLGAQGGNAEQSNDTQALDMQPEQTAPTLELVGYAGGWIVDGQVQILKVGTNPAWRRHGIARELLARVASDARDLGATSCSLEVRASNKGAQAFYESLQLCPLGVRPRYYPDGEDACILEGPLPLAQVDVAGMQLQIDEARNSSASARKLKNCVSHPLILAIETSCDETAAAIVDGEGQLVSDVVASQIDFHARFGGVVPEIASRKHIEAICGVCDECFDVAAQHLEVPSLNWKDLDAVAVTHAPGLVGALVVGVAFAKGVAWAAQKPFIGVHHLEGHLYANKIGAPDFTPPAVVSLVSGGNTLLVHMKDWGVYETLGATIDDAVGEAFDKVAKALGLGYPGGPAVSKQAALGCADAIAFPRAMMHSGDLRFSLSGLKTAVVTYINNERAAGRELNIPDICASFQQAVVDVQVKKAQMALKQTGAPTFCLGGGVAANPVLREAYEVMCQRLGVRLVLPPFSACGDNAGMIALVALDRYRQEKFFPLETDAHAYANLDEPY